MNTSPIITARVKILLSELQALSDAAADCVERHVLYAGHDRGVASGRREFNGDAQARYEATYAGDPMPTFETYMETAHAVFDEILQERN